MQKCINGTMELLCIKGFMEKDAIFLRVPDGEVIAAYNIDWFDVGSHAKVTWGAGKYWGSLNDLFCFETFINAGKKA